VTGSNDNTQAVCDAVVCGARRCVEVGGLKVSVLSASQKQGAAMHGAAD
jgi:hypothetical protein